MKKRNHRWAFNLELTRTGVCLCYSHREFAKKWLDHDLPHHEVDGFPHECSDGCHVCSHDDNRMFIWINSKLQPDSPDIFYTMIHECVHAMMGVMGMAGLQHSTDNCGETEAYMVEQLCRLCWRNLGKVTGPKARRKKKVKRRKGKK